MTVGPAGSLYFADTRNHRIRKITPEGIITTVAGTGFQGYSGDGGLAVEAQLSRPAGNAFDPAGNLVFADMGNHVIRAILADGTISTISGNGERGFGGDFGAPLEASFDSPQDVAFDGLGNLFIADTLNGLVRVVFQETVFTLAGLGTSGSLGDGGRSIAIVDTAKLARIVRSIWPRSRASTARLENSCGGSMNWARRKIR